MATEWLAAVIIWEVEAIVWAVSFLMWVIIASMWEIVAAMWAASHFFQLIRSTRQISFISKKNNICLAPLGDLRSIAGKHSIIYVDPRM